MKATNTNYRQRLMLAVYSAERSTAARQWPKLGAKLPRAWNRPLPWDMGIVARHWPKPR